MRWMSTQDGEERALDPISVDPRNQALPSRARARASVRAAIDSRAGFWLLTGDVGVGKSWLWRGLREETQLLETWVEIVVDPTLCATSLYVRITHALGLTPDRSARDAVSEWLEVGSLDGVRTNLILEECHNAADEVLEEVRLLASQIDVAKGFTSIGLVGQTKLLRRLTTRVHWPIMSRISARIHLHSLDADEVGDFLNTLAPEREFSTDQAEAWQMMTAGNPRLIHQKLATLKPIEDTAELELPVRLTPTIRPTPPPRPTPNLTREVEPTGRSSELTMPPMLGPSRPPIRLSEGVIEVGWEPEKDQDHLSEDSELGVDDRKAAVQAWTAGAGVGEPVTVSGTTPRDFDQDSGDADDPPAEEPPWIRADEVHEHAPFSPMFSKMKRTRDVE